MKLKTLLLPAVLLLCAPAFAQTQSSVLLPDTSVTFQGKDVTWTDKSPSLGYKVEIWFRNSWFGAATLAGNIHAFKTNETLKNLPARVWTIRSLPPTQGVPIPVPTAVPTPVPPVAPPSAPADSYGAPVKMGNPFLFKPGGKVAMPVFARNVWDMRAFGDKIFLGHGDMSSNIGGRVTLWALDTKKGVFQNETTLSTEQINEFWEVDGQIATADTDPAGKLPAKIYLRDANAKWIATPGVPEMAHVFSVARFENTLFMGGGNWPDAQTTNFDIYASDNNSPTWRGARRVDGVAANGFAYHSDRTYSLLPLGSELYALQSWMSTAPVTTISKWNRATKKFVAQPVSPLLLDGDFALDVRKPALLSYRKVQALADGSALAILSSSDGDAVANGISLMHICDFEAEDVSKIELPEGFAPYDFLVRDDTVFVCAWDAAQKQNAVFALEADDLSAAPGEVLRFAAPTFARSFEKAGDDFYFGLGCDSKCKPAETGEIWKVAPLEAPQNQAPSAHSS